MQHNPNHTTPAKTEAKIQQEIFIFFHNNFCLPKHKPRSLILSIPNEKKPELVKTGLYPGAADLLILHKGQTFFIEVKKQKGTQTHKQKKFQKHATEAGATYILVHSLDEFKKALNLDI